MRDRPFPQWHTTCATPGFTRAPSQPAQVQPSPPEREPRFFNKRIILWGAEKCCRNVTAVRYDQRARRAERVVRDFVGIGVRTESRRSRTSSPDTRERGTGYHRGYFRQPSQPTSLYIDPSPSPHLIRVYPRRFCSHPPHLAQICPKFAPQAPSTSKP